MIKNQTVQHVTLDLTSPKTVNNVLMESMVQIVTKVKLKKFKTSTACICNPKGGKCDINGNCICSNNANEGFWAGQGCYECQRNFDPNGNCKICLDGFDISKQCLKCNEGRYGDKCDLSKKKIPIQNFRMSL
jgi:hypothetical protein